MSWDLDSLRVICWALLVLWAAAALACESVNAGIAAIWSWSGDSEAAAVKLSGLSWPGLLLSLWPLALLAWLAIGWPTVFAVMMSSFAPLFWAWLITAVLRHLVWSHYAAWRAQAFWPQIRRLWRIGSIVNLLVVSVVLAGIIKGVPFHLDNDVHPLFLGDVWGLVNFFSSMFSLAAVSLMLLCGVAVLSALGCCDDRALAIKLAALFLLAFAFNGWWLTHLEGYHISSDIPLNAESNPLAKFVKRGEGLWMDNYEHDIWLADLPTLTALSALSALVCAYWRRYAWTALSALLTVVCAVVTTAVTLFPFMLPSNLSLNSAMTLWDCSAGLAVLQWWWPTAALTLPLFALMTRYAWSKGAF
jgi:cytochrome bd ubiquinol oxidase subunit II